MKKSLFIPLACGLAAAGTLAQAQPPLTTKHSPELRTVRHASLLAQAADLAAPASADTSPDADQRVAEKRAAEKEALDQYVIEKRTAEKRAAEKRAAETDAQEKATADKSAAAEDAKVVGDPLRGALEKRVAELSEQIRKATAAGDTTTATKLSAQLAQIQARLAATDGLRNGLGNAPTVSIRREPTGIFLIPSFAPGPKLDLDLKELPPSAAFQNVLETGKIEYIILGKIPDAPLITIRVANVRVGTALSLISEASGVGVAQEVVDGKLRYRIGGPLPTSPESLRLNQMLTVPNPDEYTPGFPSQPPFADVTIARMMVTEERSAFNCPHCKGQVTVLRKRQQPRCPKCSQMFQPNWQFCPNDGAKRPETTGEWKFCPLCGKAVKLERSDSALPPADQYSAPLEPVAPPEPRDPLGLPVPPVEVPQSLPQRPLKATPPAPTAPVPPPPAPIPSVVDPASPVAPNVPATPVDPTSPKPPTAVK